MIYGVPQWIYKEAWEREKTHVHIMPDIPQLCQAKLNSYNISDVGEMAHLVPKNLFLVILHEFSILTIILNEIHMLKGNN